MPIKSKAQRRKFAQLLVEGKISDEVYEEWNRSAGKKELPERLHPTTDGARKRAPARKATTAGKARKAAPTRSAKNARTKNATAARRRPR